MLRLNQLIRKYSNDKSFFKPIDGLLVHFRDEGRKDDGAPILLLLHGAFSSLHTFDGWVQELKNDFRIIRFDLPGFGLTGPTEDNLYSVEMYTDFLIHFMESFHLDKVFLAGSSLGGWMTWEFAWRYPDKVGKMLLIDAAGYLSSRAIPLPFKMARLPFGGTIMSITTPRNIFVRLVNEVYGDKSKVTDELIDRYYDHFLRIGNREAFISIAKSDYIDNTAQLKKIAIPTLIMWGSEDAWIPVSFAHRFVNEIPDARLIIYEGVGHVPMEENPIVTAEDAKEFFLEST